MNLTQLRQPAEWERHSAVWTAWPSHPELWEDALEPARKEVKDFVNTIADRDRAGKPRGEHVYVVTHGADAEESARLAFSEPGVDVVPMPFGDIWLRDTGPIFLNTPTGPHAALFAFNGWGGKYDLPGDREVGATIAARTTATVHRHAFTLEGGAVDSDGRGTLLTTRECLLNPNRNPGTSEEDMTARLKQALGAEKVIWLERGLQNDHTDGHVDNLARFIAPGVVACPEPTGEDDPNAALFTSVIEQLRETTDARGDRLRVVPIPSPGRCEIDGEIAPASHMNFYISNTRVILPVYHTGHGDTARIVLQHRFPNREVIALPARHILTGGGSFHCITQQQPYI